MHPRRYSPDHVWIDSMGRVGVTTRMLEALPSIERLHLPSVGAELRAATVFGSLEGDKGSVDLYAPCDGVVLEIAPGLRPRVLGADQWLIRLEGEPGPLLSLDAYLRLNGTPMRHR